MPRRGDGQGALDWGVFADPDPDADPGDPGRADDAGSRTPNRPGDLPVPPLRLRRIRLQGVGPDGARFDPLDLDFTTSTGAASRVLLSLTNTGGKSTLITLVSSLVVPASRAQVGGKNLGDYVLTGDTSHVVCEWEDATTKARTVTGTVMEWKDGRRQPGHKQRSTTNMHRAWYLFRTAPGQPGIDDLPFVDEDGRRTTFQAFCGKAADLVAPHAAARWSLTSTQQQWTDALERLTSVDPVLFGYQMRMNDSEAGAEKLLASFDSPDNVVRFFVAALNDDREISDLTEKLTRYAELAVDRPRLEALAAFGGEVGPKIVQVAQRAESVTEAEAALARARVAGGDHAATLANRLVRDRETLVELERAARSAAAEAGQLRREYGQISDIRLQLQLEAARARLAVAREALAGLEAARDTAVLNAGAWNAVDAVLDVERARAERDSAREAYERADADLAPLRTSVAGAASSLGARLAGLADEAKQAADAADAEASAARKASTEAMHAARAAGVRIRDAERDLADLDRTIQAAETASAGALERGWLTPGERPERCERRWDESAERASQHARDQAEVASAAEAAFDGLEGVLKGLDAGLVDLRKVADGDESRLSAFDDELAALASEPTIAALLGGPPAGPGDTARAADLAGRAAAQADVRAAEHDRVAAVARAELAHLDETGTAPTGPDVVAVLAVLVGAGIGAVTGLEWIEHNVADAGRRPGFIAERADIAGGVIVTDGARFDEAVTRLDAAGVRTRTPVTLATAPGEASFGSTPAEAGGHRHVVLPHRATWDRDWAMRIRPELEQAAKENGAAASAARQAAGGHRDARAACAAFTTRWSPLTRSDLARQVTESAGAVAGAVRERAGVDAERTRHREAARLARESAEAAKAEAAQSREFARLAEALVAVATEAAEAARLRAEAEAAKSRAEHDLAEAEAMREAAAEAAEAGVQVAAEARALRDPLLRERAELGVDATTADPGGNVDVLRRAWRARRTELEARERGMVEAGVLDRAERRLGEAAERRDRHAPNVLGRAAEFSATIMASTGESLAGAQRRARAEAGRAERDHARGTVELEAADTAVRAAEPSAPGRANHIELSSVPDWAPARPADIPDLLARLEARNSDLLRRRDEAEAAESDARELSESVAADVAAFDDVAGLWTAGTVATPRVFAGNKATAREQMRAHLERHRDAERREQASRGALRDAVVDAQAVAGDVRWRDLDAPAAIRVRSLRDADLVAEAAVLARRIAAMTESAAGDLAGMDTHRSILRDGLVSLCRDQRRLLREVSRSSRLPSGLGELSQQAAIKIRFEDAPEDEASARLAARVDRWAGEIAANPKRASSADVRSRWLADAVRDTVTERARAGAWTVEILKPRIDGKVAYCPPDRIPQEFSGGQVLTLAVLVYCALSGVRSAHRSGGSRPPGTLILDNPFGAASAETLIDMQHRLAAHTGLQLICATGLNDAGVEAAFTGPGSVIVKLRNDGDLRRNLSFLRMRARYVDGVDLAAAITGGRDPASPNNWVDATSYEIRR